MINKKIILAGMIGLSLTVMATGCGTARVNPNFNTRLPEIKRVLVVPPDISIERIVFKGDNEFLFDESKVASKMTQQIIENELVKRNYDVVPFEAAEDLLKSRRDIASALNLIIRKHANVSNDVQKQYVSKLKYDDFKMTMGSEINEFADLVEADALFFSNGTGFVKSGGEIAKDVIRNALVGVVVGAYVSSPTKGGFLALSMIDADNGDVLWHNFTPMNIQYDLTKEAGAAAMGRQAIHSLPKSPTGSKITAGSIGKAALSLPYAAARLTAKTGKVVGESSYDFTKEAIQATTKLGKAGSDTVLNLMTLGAYRAGRGDQVGAANAYLEATRVDKKNPWPYLLLAQSFYQSGNYKDARKFASKATKINPTFAQAHLLVAKSYNKLEKHEKAEAAFDKYKSLYVGDISEIQNVSLDTIEFEIVEQQGVITSEIWEPQPQDGVKVAEKVTEGVTQSVVPPTPVGAPLPATGSASVVPKSNLVPNWEGQPTPVAQKVESGDDFLKSVGLDDGGSTAGNESDK